MSHHLEEEEGTVLRGLRLEQQAQNIGMIGAANRGKAELRSELEDEAEH